MVNNKVQIIRLKNGKLQVAFVNPLTKKRIRKRFNTIEEAKKFEKEVEVLFSKTKLEHLQYLTINELIEMHFEIMPNSKADSRRVAFDSFIENFGNVEIGNLSPHVLSSWLRDLQLKHDYAEITLAHIKGALNHFFNFLIGEGIISKSPLSHFKINRSAPPKRPRVFLTQNEIKDILNKAREYSPNFLYPYFMALVHTGARRAEIIALEWKDVDLINNVLRIVDAKGGTLRPVKMTPQLRKLIESLPKTSKNVFCNPLGERIGRSQLHRHIISFQYAYPHHKKWGLHTFRHSFAYNFLKNGGQMYELMAVLGHKSIGLTIDLYGKLRSEDVENPSPYEFE